MRAVVLTEYGDVDKLELRDIPEPEAGPGQIKVRVEGSSVNPIDYKLRSGQRRETTPLALPTVLGRDVSGEVVAVGPGTSRFGVGARVVGLVNRAYAEYVVADESAFADAPSMDLLDAAAIPLASLTGWQLIDEAVQPDTGDAVLVLGAVGSVGRCAVYAAKLRGARVFAGVRRSQKAEAASLSAADIFAVDDDAELDRIPRLDAIANTVAGPTIEKLVGKLAEGGTIGSVVGEPKGANQAGLVVRTLLAHPDAKRLGELARAAAAGELIIPIAARLPLAQIREAHALAEKGAGGKVVLRVR